MVDNIDITAGTGTTVATDEVSSEHYQKIKLADGADDSATMVEAGSGTAANALRVVIATDNGDITIADGGNTITVDGTVTANLSATDNAVLDAIQAAVEVIDNAISGSEMQVDVLTMPTVTIQDGGNTITIDGTVDLGATDNAVLDAIQAAVETIDDAIAGTEMQVDVVASLPAGTNLIGNVKVSDGTETANVNASNELQVRDDDANTDLNTIAGAVAGTEMQVDNN